jgi:MFS-type transporter involved in bile tolerance (Atg22 family)
MPAGWEENRAAVSTLTNQFLNSMATPKSDVAIYALGILLGMCAGILEVTIGDMLATALFALVSTLVLGFLRPRHAWRWILVVGIFVPLFRLAAYLFLAQKPYRAQIWESGLGLLTGVAGAYSGVFARLGVDELIRQKTHSQ